MKATHLIEILQSIVDKDGDLDIHIDVRDHYSSSPYRAELQHSKSWNFTYTVYAGGKSASINCWLKPDSSGKQPLVTFRK
jgi:hypothetical protein